MHVELCGNKIVENRFRMWAIMIAFLHTNNCPHKMGCENNQSMLINRPRANAHNDCGNG